ncbi:MAG TPA: GNAT family N-acetyltransferase [Fimbriimonadaceae bacterium]|nr:GNAT family N-acetyltransferase [Fimbriimonadaceae bacterium]
MTKTVRSWLHVENGLPHLETERMQLRIARAGEAGKIVRYLIRNRAHLQPWEPKRDDFYFTEAAWIGGPERDQKEAQTGIAYRFRMLLKPGADPKAEVNFNCPTSEYIGTISLRNITPFPGYNATLGYSLDHSVEGRGLMIEGVRSVLRFAFEHLNLRRVEACFMPANVRSEKLLLGLGFQVEGLLRSSLEVNGRWEDHCISSLINQNWRRS